MKKTILIILTALICKFAFSQTVKIRYQVDENGKVTLELTEGEGYLHKPSQQDPAYYLYTKADRIYFDIAGDEKDKTIELKDAKMGDFWPMMEKADGTPAKCQSKTQPFSDINKYNIFLFRNSQRPTALVKDEFLIGGQKVYVWAKRGRVDFTVGDTTVTQNAKIVIKNDTTLSIRGNKHGAYAILKGISINKEPVPTRIADDFPQEESEIRKDTTITRKTKSFTVSLLYDYLDENYNPREGCITVTVDIKRHGFPAWIFVILGGAILILLIIWGIRAGKMKKSKETTSNDNSSENTDVTKEEPSPDITPQAQTDEEPQSEEKKDDKGGKTADTGQVPGEELPPDITPQAQTDEVPQSKEHKDDKGGKTADTGQVSGEELPAGDSAARIKELSGKLQQQEKQLKELNSDIESYRTKLKEQKEALDQKKSKIESIQKELNIANSNVKKYKQGKDEAVKKADELKQDLEKEKKDHNKTKGLLAAAEAKASAQIESIKKQCKEEIETAKKDCTAKIDATIKDCTAKIDATIKDCTAKIDATEKDCTAKIDATKKDCSAQIDAAKKDCSAQIDAAKMDCTKQIEAQKKLYTTEIKQIKESCESRLVNWRADKDAFLTGICKPVERLYQISDDISNDLEDSAKDLTEYLDYIVSSLREFSERVQNKSGEDGEWKNGTNTEAEKAIQKELVDLIRNNSSWINAIARLYCYSRVKEIGQSFEENGMKVAAIDSAYRDMVSFLGRYGITVIVPRILVDYYDDISKKYFGFNNEDNAISRFVSRGVLIQNQDTLKIYDMGRIAYYLDGKITKGEIVHF